jgi:hypothetical protein
MTACKNELDQGSMSGVCEASCKSKAKPPTHFETTTPLLSQITLVQDSKWFELSEKQALL